MAAGRECLNLQQVRGDFQALRGCQDSVGLGCDTPCPWNEIDGEKKHLNQYISLKGASPPLAIVPQLSKQSG
jgi:hypothetical protein